MPGGEREEGEDGIQTFEGGTEQQERLKTKEWLTEEEKALLDLPRNGTKVFIGGIHRECTADEVREFAGSVGEVYSVHMEYVDDDKTCNRGFGFVTYNSVVGALAALDTLEGKEMAGRSGYPVRVKSSELVNSLMLKNVPRELDRDQLREMLERPFELVGLTKVWIVPTKTNYRPVEDNKNTGIAFLHFWNHECAKVSKEKLCREGVVLNQNAVHVDFARNSSESLSERRAVMLKNIPPRNRDWGEEDIERAYSKYGEIERVGITRAKGGSDTWNVFVRFRQRVPAFNAVYDKDKPSINGHVPYVTYAKDIAHRPVRNRYDHPPRNDRGRYHHGHRPRGGGRGGRGQMMGMVPVQLPDGQVCEWMRMVTYALYGGNNCVCNLLIMIEFKCGMQIGYMMQPVNMMSGGGFSGYNNNSRRHRGGHNYYGGGQRDRQWSNSRGRHGQRDRYQPY